MLACVFENIFPALQLETSLLVCDGGSANAAVIKASHGYHGAYSVKATGRFKVEPWITNPFNPPNQIYWIICPSHQVQCVMLRLIANGCCLSVG